jgi:hypothetical protein
MVLIALPHSLLLYTIKATLLLVDIGFSVVGYDEEYSVNLLSVYWTYLEIGSVNIFSYSLICYLYLFWQYWGLNSGLSK